MRLWIGNSTELCKLLDSAAQDKSAAYQVHAREQHIVEYFYKELVDVIAGCKEIVTQPHYML